MNTLKSKLNKTLNHTKSAASTTKGATSRLERQLWTATAEMARFEEILQKVQETVLVDDSRYQNVVEDMKRCGKSLAFADADKGVTMKEIDELEGKLSKIGSSKTSKDNSDAKITAIQQVKNLRNELTKREEHIKDLDDRVSLETDKLKNLGNELKMLGPVSMNGISPMRTGV